MRLVACGQCHTQYDVSGVELPQFDCPCGHAVENVSRGAVEAEVRRCGSCGALLQAGDSGCAYCGAAVHRDPGRLRLLCPECYARNQEGTRFCTSCGVEFRPQPIWSGDDIRSCPACQEMQMVARSIAGTIVQGCPQCGGLWVPGGGFDGLVKRAIDAQRLRRTGPGVVPRPDGVSFQSAVEYRCCPECHSPMQRKNFARRSGVIVDWCGRHGTWLDAHELEHIATFVRKGGLDDVPPQRNGRPAWSQPTNESTTASALADVVVAMERRSQAPTESLVSSIGEFLARLLT